MHRKPLMIGKSPGDARWRRDAFCSAPDRTCKRSDNRQHELENGSIPSNDDAGTSRVANQSRQLLLQLAREERVEA